MFFCKQKKKLIKVIYIILPIRKTIFNIVTYMYIFSPNPVGTHLCKQVSRLVTYESCSAHFCDRYFMNIFYKINFNGWPEVNPVSITSFI